MDDEQLVVAALAGDRKAYAAIYDRYADRIHDFCASILRNRADASDALQETFLVAFEALDLLAEADRLGAWLYAIAHRAILDRIPSTGSVGGDEADDLVWGSGPTTGPPGRPAPEERLSRAELSEFVWQASGGLAARDRTMIDLHLRHGLEGRDLASAAGIAGSVGTGGQRQSPQVDERVRRLVAQVERSLGALVVARTGRRGCPDLYAILVGWDGRLTDEFRTQVTAHVDDCEVCNSRRRIVPSPLALLAAAPLSPAPAYLRSSVLSRAETEARQRLDDTGGRALVADGWAFNREGFPDLGLRPSSRPSGGAVFAGTSPTAALSVDAGAGGMRPPGTAPTMYLPTADRAGPVKRDHDRRGALVGALAGMIVLIAGTVILLSSRSHAPKAVGVGVTTSTLTATTAADNITTTSTTPDLGIIPSTIAPTTTLATVGHLTVGGTSGPATGHTGTLDLGVTTGSASVTVGNSGTASLSFTVTALGTGLTVSPVAGTVAAGTGQPLTVSLDRTAGAPGPFSGSIMIASDAGNATVTVTAIIDPGPTINTPTAVPTLVAATSCPKHATTTSAVMVTVTGSEPVQEVVLHWQPESGQGGGSSPMTSAEFGYTGTLGPFPATGTVDWWVGAIDNAGVSSTTTHFQLPVSCS